MDFETFVIDKLNFINDELTSVFVNIDLLRVELEMVKIRLTLVEAFVEEAIWWIRAIGIAFITLVVGQIWSFFHKRKKNNKV